MIRNATLACFGIVACIALLIAGLGRSVQNAGASGISVPGPSSTIQPAKLVILWTSGDRDVAIQMAFMYARAAWKNKWWDRITLVVWGPSAKLLSEDKELQASIHEMKRAGIRVQACIVCANNYEVTPKLRALGVEVKGMGEPLTDMLRSGWTLISV